MQRSQHPRIGFISTGLRIKPASRLYRFLAVLGVVSTLNFGGGTMPALGQTIGETLLAQSQTGQQSDQHSNEQLGKLLQDARKAIDNRNYSEAITLYTQASPLDPKNARIFSGIAFAYSQMGRFADAANAFRQAIALDNNNADLQYGLALSLNRMGAYNDAIVAYRRTLELDNTAQNRNRTDTYLGLGIALEKSGDLAGAFTTYQQLLSLSPKDGRVYDAVSAVLIKQKRFEEALPLIQKAIDLSPNNAGSYINLGITWIGLRNPQRAMVAFQQAQQMNPQDGGIYLTLGEIFQRSGEPDQAFKMYQEAVRFAPNQSAPRQRLVEFFLGQKDYLRAIVYAKLWKDQLPQDANAYRYLGIALQGRGYPVDARAAWESAKTLYRQQGNIPALQDIERLERSLQ